MRACTAHGYVPARLRAGLCTLWPPSTPAMNLVELAQRLRRIRLERGLTLEEVASRGGLTRGWLSKVENFRVTPSLPALDGLAKGLGVSLSELFEGLDERPPLVVVRRDERRPLRRDDELSTLTYHSLAFPRTSRAMDPFIVTVPSSDTRPKLTHPGEEFLLVLTGEVMLEHGERTEALREGDSAYLDGIVPHRIVCRSGEAAQVLVVYHGHSQTPDDAPSPDGK